MVPMPARLAVLALAAAVHHYPVAHGLDNGLARTPPMGYNTWYDVTGAFDEALLLKTVGTYACASASLSAGAALLFSELPLLAG
jgi:hypothetical protein|eukprot:COSAG06_NODE_5530_length_3421_cov_3.429561_3_plen_84_part_00